MCGIAGIYHYNSDQQAVDRDRLINMREVMHARGPDDAGLWISGQRHVGFAHRRLSIIDLSSGGHQPMINQDGSLVIVFNGEIYNFRELRAKLETQGYAFRSHSDTEVLLHLYAAYGQEMCRKLRGMYAFVIWDEKKQGLFAARDPFGIKPLYYADDGKTFRFASQVKALLAGGGIDSSPDPAGHVSFFLWGYIRHPYTFYKGIRELPPGHALWIDRTNKTDCRCFFDMADEFRKQDETLPVKTAEERQQYLRDALLDSVKHHLIADVPVNLFLSAGLDSSTILGLASELYSQNLQACTLAFQEFEGTQRDELPLAQVLAEQYGSTHRVRRVCGKEFSKDLPAIFEAMDQPSVDGINTYYISKVSAEMGVKVALSGLGGDEMFGGYWSSFHQIPSLVKGLHVFQYFPFVGKAFRWVSAPWLKYKTSPKYAGVLEYGNTYGGAYLLRRSLCMPWELPDFLDADLVRDGWRELQPLLRLEETIQGIHNTHCKVSALEMAWYMRSQLLKDSDWAGMAHSLEIRVPLVDIRLLRSLAPLLCQTPPPTKLDMASTPAKALPEAVLSRRKTGFRIPVRDWIMAELCPDSTDRSLRGWAKLVYQNFVK